MLIQSIPESRAAEAAWVSRMTAQFLASGGEIDVLVQAPPPPRRPVLDPPQPRARQEPTPPKAMLPTLNSKRFAEYPKAMLDDFDGGMTLTELCTKYGKPRSSTTIWLELNRRDPGANRYNRHYSDVTDEMIETLRSMAANRYSQRYAGTCMGLNRDQVGRIARRYGITFGGERQREIEK